ncbi:hypothetical protein CTheo_7140 [Ceratobasidium theobromae]|uniref:Uncharacterized protein n=1 Tax=Ceratobasidium theobromae TaxID=1582974 RepID=A0A5N5QCD7_9AGAM|nr:hypothetical protein CTheo_7140 [Ceratobasidium theobromae]
MGASPRLRHYSRKSGICRLNMTFELEDSCEYQPNVSDPAQSFVNIQAPGVEKIMNSADSGLIRGLEDFQPPATPLAALELRSNEIDSESLAKALDAIQQTLSQTADPVGIVKVAPKNRKR